MKKASVKLKAETGALGTMSPAQLKCRWIEPGLSASHNLPPSLLRRLLAQRIQECSLRNLPAAVVRELERAGRTDGSSAVRQALPLAPGARLMREWNGQTITVEVREDGFWWQEQSWRSLSEIARTVTG